MTSEKGKYIQRIYKILEGIPQIPGPDCPLNNDLNDLIKY